MTKITLPFRAVSERTHVALVTSALTNKPPPDLLIYVHPCHNTYNLLFSRGAELAQLVRAWGM